MHTLPTQLFPGSDPISSHWSLRLPHLSPHQRHTDRASSLVQLLPGGGCVRWVPSPATPPGASVTAVPPPVPGRRVSGTQ